VISYGFLVQSFGCSLEMLLVGEVRFLQNPAYCVLL